MAIYHARVHDWKQAWLMLFFMCKRSIVIGWVGTGEGACPSSDYRNKILFVPTQHPIFTPNPDNRWCNYYHEVLHFRIKIMSFLGF